MNEYPEPEEKRKDAGSMEMEGFDIGSLENDELIIEENTIYEIDLNCYECLQKERRKRQY